MTAKEVAGESLLRARRAAYRGVRRAGDKLGATFITDEELRRALGGRAMPDVAARLRERREPRLLAGLGDLPQTADLIRQFYPDSVEAARQYADEVGRHRIRLFGQAIDL